jgi:hypothetical protein
VHLCTLLFVFHNLWNPLCAQDRSSTPFHFRELEGLAYWTTWGAGLVPKTLGICRCVTNLNYTLTLFFSCSFLLSSSQYNNTGSSSIGCAMNITLCHMLHPFLDALSLDGMTAYWGAPPSRATCYMHHATCYAHSAGGCPIFRDAGSRVQLQYSRAEEMLNASPTRDLNNDRINTIEIQS